MRENQVWELIDRPITNSEGGKLNLISSRWIFKRKIDKDQQVKYKARLVVRGFQDRNEYELRETYAPVSRLTVSSSTFQRD